LRSSKSRVKKTLAPVEHEETVARKPEEFLNAHKHIALGRKKGNYVETRGKGITDTGVQNTRGGGRTAKDINLAATGGCNRKPIKEKKKS